MIIDTHAHLDFPDYNGDLAAVLQNAKDAGVGHIINVGTDLDSSRKSIDLASGQTAAAGGAVIYASIGIHPNHTDNAADGDFTGLEALTEMDAVVAIGETGLDYYRDHSGRDGQKLLFRRHIELAIERQLPLIIHCREANDDCLGIIGDYAHNGMKGVVHCFSADKTYAKRFLDLGLYISFTGTVTFPKADKLREAIKFVPTDRLLLETDSPFLAPQAQRGKRNEPAFLRYIIPCIAECLCLSDLDIARVTSRNAGDLFGIGGKNTDEVIAYAIRDSLYLNITSRCPNSCVFCTRSTHPFVKGHCLKLDAEPSAERLITAIGDPSEYDEVVFCGYGEPTERVDVIKTVARYLKEKGTRTRLNTNGLGDLINSSPVCPELSGLIDTICISLNSHTGEQYEAMCKPRFGKDAYPALLSFIRDAGKVIPNVVVSVVDIPEVDVGACKKIADDLGVSFKVRKYNDTGFKNPEI